LGINNIKTYIKYYKGFFMLKITVAELEKHNINIKGEFEINVQGKTFRKETILSKKVKDQIARITEKYSSDSLEVIVVEHQLFFSIWIENKIDNTNTTPEEDKNKISQDEISENQQPVKKVAGYYRGISYEVGVPEYIPQSSVQLDKKRKFRGQEY